MCLTSNGVFADRMPYRRASNVPDDITALHIPRLGPGSYRIVVKNDLPQPTNYTVRHSRGMG